MKTQLLAIGLTAINLAVLVCTMAQLQPATAQTVAPVLRGHALEIVDEHGKVRAQIAVQPAGATRDGRKYPETVLLRLIDPNGRPGVKLGTSADGSGLALSGDSERRDWSGVQILADSEGTVVKLTSRDGREHVVKP